ncbi:SDR family oxidoreductase [Myceligenerans crystallogenes]|uniref:SDR family NAD(P)-dependent oxidoreductase n=1 Tax=Myceligenerans crystallogenes TaxID=316335 RepID=A0ABN2NA32_9MICO
MNTTGNTLFIPGGTSGIGLALARRFRSRGNTVVVGGRRDDVLAELAAEGFGTVRVDVADPASIREATADVVARYPELNILVAMAGMMRAEDWTTPGFLDDAEAHVTTNLLGPIRLIAALNEHLWSRDDAVVMTVSSGLAHVPLGITPTYNATKAAIHQLSESLRVQYAGSGPQVIELVPPAVRTALMPGHEKAPHAMPLDDYADEVLGLLEREPDAREILVEYVKPLRYAAVNGSYDETVAMVNAAH